MWIQIYIKILEFAVLDDTKILIVIDWVDSDDNPDCSLFDESLRFYNGLQNF